ncbi:MAG: hypothetical protein AAF399_13035, partial [Bacteroidota bacterium]
MKPISFLFPLLFAALMSSNLYGQRSKALVMNIDTKDMLTDPGAMGSMVRMELQKLNQYEVIDRYDMVEALNESNLDPSSCFSKSCLLNAAQALQADKVVSGYAERIGEKLILTLKLLDVPTESIERTEIGEFINQERDIEKMVNIVLLRLFEQTPEQVMVDNLAYYHTLDAAPSTRIINNGPRMGVAYITGPMAQRLEAPIDQGGYNAQPIVSQFGYQHEIQYLSAGNFQGLVEVLGMVSGLEQSMFIPSLTVMNGFRENKHGFEFAFGPSFSVRNMSEGYFDGEGNWQLTQEWEGDLADRPSLSK